MGSFMSKHSHASKMHSKNLIDEMPIDNRAGTKMYEGPKMKSYGPKDHNKGYGPKKYKGPHVEKDEFGNEIPKGFKSDLGNFNPTITSETKFVDNVRTLTNATGKPFTEGSNIKTRQGDKNVSITVLKDNKRNRQVKSQDIKRRTDTYSS
jgi:N-acetylmuramoyl-L-alanine amidase CwlA